MPQHAGRGRAARILVEPPLRVTEPNKLCFTACVGLTVCHFL